MISINEPGAPQSGRPAHFRWFGIPPAEKTRASIFRQIQRIFFDRSAYFRMMNDVENGKIGVCIMKDLTRWERDYLHVGNVVEIVRRNNMRFIAVNNGIGSEKPDTLEYTPFINVMSEYSSARKLKILIFPKSRAGESTPKMPLLSNRYTERSI